MIPGHHYQERNSDVSIFREKEHEHTFLQQLRDAVLMADEFNAKYLSVFPGYSRGDENRAWQQSRLVDTLKRGADIVEKRGKVMLIMPVNKVDHPGSIINRISEAYQVCRLVERPSCKILYDFYHQQAEAGDLIHNLEMVWDEIGYIVFKDFPGGMEPGTGEIYFPNILRYLHQQNFQGIIGMAHGLSDPSAEGVGKMLGMYRAMDAAL